MTLEGSPRIAVVRLSAVGDVVHTLPLIRSLRRGYPSAHISWVIQPGPFELVRDHPDVDEFILFDRTSLVRGLLDLRRRLHGRQFDLVLVPHTAFKAGLVGALLNAPRKIGFDAARSVEGHGWFVNERIAARPRGHQIDEMLEFADHLDLFRVEEWGLGPEPSAPPEFAGLVPEGRPLIAISLATSQGDKDWAAERWAELADRLISERDATVMVVGGTSRAEQAAWETLSAKVQSPRLADRRAHDLRRLAWLIGQADLFVGADSAPLHIAEALGTPAVALVGSSNPWRFGPWKARAGLIDAFSEPGEAPDASAADRPGRMARISVRSVFDRTAQLLARPEVPESEPT